jgi:hypothetical protein
VWREREAAARAQVNERNHLWVLKKSSTIQFLSQREAIDTEGPLGRAIIVIVSAIAELEEV